MKDPNVKSDVEGAPGSTAATFLGRLQENDRNAWHRFSRLYGPMVYAWCRRKGLQASDAADVTQEVLQVVSQKIHAFVQQETGTFRGWLWTITLNRLRDYFRRRERIPDALGGSDAQFRMQQLVLDESEPESEKDTAAFVHRALELIRIDFRETSWQAFVRTTLQGHSPSDVAQDLGISTNAVYVARSRILSRLRQELEAGGFA